MREPHITAFQRCSEAAGDVSQHQAARPMSSNRPKRFLDDGTSVLVDLHGCSVDEALYVIGRTLSQAYGRGRSKVDVIHGTSTSDTFGYTRTIKNEFERRLTAGEYDAWVSGRVHDPSGGRTSLAIKIGSKKDSRRIREIDVVRS